MCRGGQATETCSYLVDLIHNNYQIHLVVLQTAPFLLISFAYTTVMTYPKIKTALLDGNRIMTEIKLLVSYCKQCQLLQLHQPAACVGGCKNTTYTAFLFVKLYTGRFIMFSVITNIYNKKTKGPTLMELFTATGIL